MRHNLDVDVVARVGQAHDESADDGAEDEELRNGRVRKAGRYHCEHEERRIITLTGAVEESWRVFVCRCRGELHYARVSAAEVPQWSCKVAGNHVLASGGKCEQSMWMYLSCEYNAILEATVTMTPKSQCRLEVRT